LLQPSNITKLLAYDDHFAIL